MVFRPELIDSVRDLSVSANKRAKALKAEADAAARIEKFLKRLYSLLEKGWPLHILALLDRESTLLETLRSKEHPAIKTIEGVCHDAKEQADSIKRRYPAHLEEVCRAVDLSLDAESRHPTYTLEQQFFQLKVDEKRWVARISDYEKRLETLPADVDAVVQVLLREKKRVFGRPFNGPSFLEELRAQYLAVVKEDQQTDGASIPIRHITRRLEENLKGFRSDEFVIDLSRLVEQGPIDIDGYRLDLQQTKDTSQGMLLHGIAGRGYIGFIVFRKV